MLDVDGRHDVDAGREQFLDECALRRGNLRIGVQAGRAGAAGQVDQALLGTFVEVTADREDAIEVAFAALERVQLQDRILGLERGASGATSNPSSEIVYVDVSAETNPRNRPPKLSRSTVWRRPSPCTE